MANSIDWGTLALGALVGVGCRKQIKSASRIAAATAASLAGAAAAAVNSAAEQINKDQSTQGQNTNVQTAGQKNGN